MKRYTHGTSQSMATLAIAASSCRAARLLEWTIANHVRAGADSFQGWWWRRRGSFRGARGGWRWARREWNWTGGLLDVSWCLVPTHLFLYAALFMTSLFLMWWTRIMAAAFIRGQRLFHSAPSKVRRLFEGGVYSRVAFNRINTVLSCLASPLCFFSFSVVPNPM